MKILSFTNGSWQWKRVSLAICSVNSPVCVCMNYECTMTFKCITVYTWFLSICFSFSCYDVIILHPPAMPWITINLVKYIKLMKHVQRDNFRYFFFISSTKCVGTQIAFDLRIQKYFNEFEWKLPQCAAHSVQLLRKIFWLLMFVEV